MDAKVTWNHDMSFTGVGAGSEILVPIGSRPAPDQPAEGTSPMEMVLMAMAGCTAMDVISILKKKRQDVTGFEVRVHGDRAEQHPRVYTHITLEYVVTGRHVEEAAVQRSIQLSLEKYCSVHAMLSKAVPIEHSYRVIEEEPAAAHSAGS